MLEIRGGGWARRFGALLLTASVLVACGDDAEPTSNPSEVAGETTSTAIEGTGEGLLLVDPLTDNYKACFNADPDAYEERTWLSFTELRHGEVSYTPASPGIVDATAGLDLVGTDGSTAMLVASASPVTTARTQGSFRADETRFGYLATVVSPEALAADPLRLTLTLEHEGEQVATVDAVYSYDEALAEAPPGTPEHNGPAGRWGVAGAPTETDHERSPYGC